MSKINKADALAAVDLIKKQEDLKYHLGIVSSAGPDANALSFTITVGGVSLFHLLSDSEINNLKLHLKQQIVESIHRQNYKLVEDAQEVGLILDPNDII